MLWNWTTAFEDIEVLRKEMNHLFERSQGSFVSGSANFPLINLYNQDDKILVIAETPGLKKEDIDIHFLEGSLKIKGQRQFEQEGDKLLQLRQERATGAFEKTIRIPLEVKADQISARLQDGVLQIELPKADQVKPLHISIQ